MAQQMGYAVVAGIDEVGLGPLAGPAVAGAVVLRIGERLPGLNDSKQLTPEQRERLDRLIRRRAVAWGIGAVGPEEIDRHGLTRARQRAMQAAVASLHLPAEYLLVDAWDVPELPLPQLCVVKGDSSCASIMAASIVAKVYRDRLMVEYDQQYPGYGFAGHKGYATRAHKLALWELGPSPIHRMSWAPIRAVLAGGPEVAQELEEIEDLAEASLHDAGAV
ncbi:MAG: ribonuclease HII [Candidatus Dormibacteraeota bacterium]|nr:ribonuclease HII [Candidatus Dormibacteraeota bacterium]